ncbi:hypothetical protein CNMCM7691_005144 [Aspergillus felis]|uniref:ABC-2 type transporter transmembrane domain-containing protein n=1 Tax=Aspergillus felis TaxID=1287682 RepID=A0A8H6V6S2_9EURO|nr:hypothetical protein CNMCM7691_005144 [Aspergillus felis]
MSGALGWLYEVRERPSKTYSWKVFMAANIIVELPWNTLMAVLMYFCWYYPVGFYKNAEPTHAVTERGALMFLFIWAFLLFTSTFAHMLIAGIELPETADAGFWVFMYRVMTPFTYIVSGMLSTGLSGNTVVCEPVEYLHFNPPGSLTCLEYMEPS